MKKYTEKMTLKARPWGGGRAWPLHPVGAPVAPYTPVVEATCPLWSLSFAIPKGHKPWPGSPLGTAPPTLKSHTRSAPVLVTGPAPCFWAPVSALWACRSAGTVARTPAPCLLQREAHDRLCLEMSPAESMTGQPRGPGLS